MTHLHTPAAIPLAPRHAGPGDRRPGPARRRRPTRGRDHPVALAAPRRLVVAHRWRHHRPGRLGDRPRRPWAGSPACVAAVLLLAQVLLMARVPVLERAFGQDRLVRIHRLVGLTSFNLMVAHVVTHHVGLRRRLGHRRARAPCGTSSSNYPGMLLAAAATLCLVMVVATSIRAARRRLRYESWHLMHLYAYLGVGLAIPHQLWTGADFTSSPGRQVFWWTAWAACRRERAGVARRAAGLAQPAPRPEGRRRRARGSRHGLGARHRT